MNKSILVIDDEKTQARALSFKLKEKFPDASCFEASTEEEIASAVSDVFYNLAIVDIRMDGHEKNGIDIANEIIQLNPFAKVLFVTKFLPEYISLLNPLLSSGRVLGVSEKEEYGIWMDKLTPMIMDYYATLSHSNEVNIALLDAYATAKNEADTYRKGIMFEQFVALLFRSIGYNVINKRVRDLSANEIDLVVRNEIDDSFLTKFGKYILVECKNRPDSNTSKNDFIVFKNKLNSTCGMATLGFLFTTSSIARTTYIEAVRESQGDSKVIFVDNARMEKLLMSDDLREALKSIIDSQVKDN